MFLLTVDRYALGAFRKPRCPRSAVSIRVVLTAIRTSNRTLETVILTSFILFVSFLDIRVRTGLLLKNLRCQVLDDRGTLQM